jgi:tripartite-type tricarboxylate transporter receptor subunit TctC
MVDVVGGHTKVMFSSLVQTTPHIRSGKLRALGTGGSARNPVLPDVPTIAEAGVPGYEHVLWGMLLVPAATPKDVVTRLNREAVKALESAEVRERFAGMGVEPVSSTPEQAAAYLKSETAKYAKVVKAIGLRIE